MLYSSVDSLCRVSLEAAALRAAFCKGMRRVWIGSFTTPCYPWMGFAWTPAALRSEPRAAGLRPERRVWIDSHLQSVSVRDRPRQNDSASLFGSQPRCFLDGLTAAEALIRGRQVFQLHQSRWSRGVRIRHVGRPTRELAFQVTPTPFVCCPFQVFFSGPGGC